MINIEWSLIVDYNGEIDLSIYNDSYIVLYITKTNALRLVGSLPLSCGLMLNDTGKIRVKDE